MNVLVHVHPEYEQSLFEMRKPLTRHDVPIFLDKYLADIKSSPEDFRTRYLNGRIEMKSKLFSRLPPATNLSY